MDLLAILPFWLDIVFLDSDTIKDLVIIRLIRVARIARVIQALFRDSRTKGEGELLWRVLTNTSGQIALLFLWFGIASFIFGNFERVDLP